jgi:hypothetical protein
MKDEEITALAEGLAPVVCDLVAQGTAEVTRRQVLTEVQLAHVVDVVKDLGAMRERLAVLETRAPVPGPSGAPGRDGIDGVGFDDLIVEHDGERAFTVKCVRGDVVKGLGTFRLPAMIYRDVWTDGRTYEPGDVVTWARSIWHCKKTTTLKPDGVARDGPQGKDFWTLIVARGRDGKDGKDGPPGPQGPAGRDWQQVYDDTRRR